MQIVIFKSNKNKSSSYKINGLFFVFIIAGIWHGPSWLYVIFGSLHGIGLIINHTFNRYFNFSLNRYFAWFLTFNYVNITLIFFRSKTIDSSVDIIKGMTGLNTIELKTLLNWPEVKAAD